MNHVPAEGRLAGIDYGTVRIGVAICDPDRRLASPYENYTRRDREADAGYFRRLADEQRLVGFVVGLPVHASGEESAKSREARQFGQWLSYATGRPVAFHDERYSSAEATTLLSSAGHTRKRRKQRLDMVAAQLILASFLDRQSHAAPPGALWDEPDRNSV